MQGALWYRNGFVFNYLSWLVLLCLSMALCCISILKCTIPQDYDCSTVQNIFDVYFFSLVYVPSANMVETAFSMAQTELANLSSHMFCLSWYTIFFGACQHVLVVPKFILIYLIGTMNVSRKFHCKMNPKRSGQIFQSGSNAWLIDRGPNYPSHENLRGSSFLKNRVTHIFHTDSPMNSPSWMLSF